MIVVDASVILHVLIDPEKDPGVADALGAAGALMAPSYLDLEILNSLRKKVLSKLVTEQRAAEAVADLSALPVERSNTEALNARIWELRHNMTAYDAAYVALAEALECPLLTRDARLKSAAAVHTTVRVI
jgi:predicted nucleic acid-binding protein